MAVATPNALASYDPASGTYKLDVSQILSEILLWEVNSLALFTPSMPATQTKHQWIEADLNPHIVNAAASGTGSSLTASSADVDLLFLASDYLKLRSGAILMNQAAGKMEQILVVTLDGDSVATVVREWAGTTAEAHAVSATFTIVNMARQDAEDADDDRTKDRVVRYNHTSIIERAIKMGGSIMNMQPEAIASEFTLQLTHRMMELKRELGLMLVHGGRSSTLGSSTALRSMGGLTWFLSQSGGNYVSTGTTFSEAAVNAAVKSVWDDGGDPTHLILPAGHIQTLVASQQNRIRITQDERRAGNYVTHFLSDVGIELEIVPERFMHNSQMIVTDASRLAYMPLGGRQLTSKPLGLQGDYQSWDIVGEYTCEVREYLKAHKFYSNIT
jgi:hypothetical protein